MELYLGRGSGGFDTDVTLAGITTQGLPFCCWEKKKA